MRSSASSQKIHSQLAWLTLSLRAAAKSSHHGKSWTHAPQCRATARVASVEPVSTTTISCTRSATVARQAARLASSSRAIMHKETGSMACLPQWELPDHPWRASTNEKTTFQKGALREVVWVLFAGGSPVSL